MQKKKSKVIDKMNKKYLDLLALYAMSSIKDTQIETRFWEIETIMKCLWILIGVKKIKFELFEKIIENIESIQDVKRNGAFFFEEVNKRKEVCTDLNEIAKRLQAEVNIDFKEMAKKYKVYESEFPNILLKESTLDTIKAAIKKMKSLKKQTDKPMFLIEIKELRDK